MARCGNKSESGQKRKSLLPERLDEQSFDFVIRVAEFDDGGFKRICEFRAREAFRRRDMPPIHLPTRTLLDEEDFRIVGTVLDQGIPCLAFAFDEKLRVNVWSEGLKQLKLPVGPWLKEAKRAVRRGAPDDSPIAISGELSLPLGVLKQHALRTARGQRIGTFSEEGSFRIDAPCGRPDQRCVRPSCRRGHRNVRQSFGENATDRRLCPERRDALIGRSYDPDQRCWPVPLTA